jgi:hypothetical protein
MTIVLDAGALIAFDGDERPMWVRLKAAKSRGDVPVTHAGILGQAWRGGPRQARLSQALAGIDIRALGEDLGRAAGEFPGTAGQSDVIDAAVVLIGHDGDDIITSDPEDLRPLAAQARATSS